MEYINKTDNALRNIQWGQAETNGETICLNLLTLITA